MNEYLTPIRIQNIQATWLQQQNVKLDVLRLDEWHPVVSGNKWFKLKYYLQDAFIKKYKTIATFGGAYSNHIVATAFACKERNLQSIGIIRGEKPQTLSHTLFEAQAYGMQLQFVSRDNYKNKHAIKTMFDDVYWIEEGGYGTLGANGAADILRLVDNIEIYTHIVCAVGTGTTLAGLLQTALPHQTVIGFSALKNNWSITEEVKQLLSKKEEQKQTIVIHDYHFGGYAKHNVMLLDFMNEMWRQQGLPLDFVYTAKALYGLQKVIKNKHIVQSNSRVLFVHTGGLQGNVSLPKNVLTF